MDGVSFRHVVLSHILLYYSVIQIASCPIGFETHERRTPIFHKWTAVYIIVKFLPVMYHVLFCTFTHTYALSKNDDQSDTFKSKWLIEQLTTVTVKNGKRSENATAREVRQCMMNYMMIAWLAKRHWKRRVSSSGNVNLSECNYDNFSRTTRHRVNRAYMTYCYFAVMHFVRRQRAHGTGIGRTHARHSGLHN